jgi:HTH-type transcriptional regulator/antitoxin HipB
MVMQIKNPRDIATYIKLRRAQLNLSQEALAKKAGVSRSWLAEVESGKPTAEIGKVLKLAKALETEITLDRLKDESTRSLIEEVIEKHRKLG